MKVGLEPCRGEGILHPASGQAQFGVTAFLQGPALLASRVNEVVDANHLGLFFLEEAGHDFALIAADGKETVQAAGDCRQIAVGENEDSARSQDSAHFAE